MNTIVANDQTQASRLATPFVCLFPFIERRTTNGATDVDEGADAKASDDQKVNDDTDTHLTAAHDVVISDAALEVPNANKLPPKSFLTPILVTHSLMHIGRRRNDATTIPFVIVNETRISGLHCILQTQKTTYSCLFVTDKSRNGSWMNGEKLAKDVQYVCRDGDTLFVVYPSTPKGMRMGFSIRYLNNSYPSKALSLHTCIPPRIISNSSVIFCLAFPKLAHPTSHLLPDSLTSVFQKQTLSRYPVYIDGWAAIGYDQKCRTVVTDPENFPIFISTLVDALAQSLLEKDTSETIDAFDNFHNHLQFSQIFKSISTTIYRLEETKNLLKQSCTWMPENSLDLRFQRMEYFLEKRSESSHVKPSIVKLSTASFICRYPGTSLPPFGVLEIRDYLRFLSQRSTSTEIDIGLLKLEIVCLYHLADSNPTTTTTAAPSIWILVFPNANSPLMYFPVHWQHLGLISPLFYVSQKDVGNLQATDTTIPKPANKSAKRPRSPSQEARPSESPVTNNGLAEDSLMTPAHLRIHNPKDVNPANHDRIVNVLKQDANISRPWDEKTQMNAITTLPSASTSSLEPRNTNPQISGNLANTITAPQSAAAIFDIFTLKTRHNRFYTPPNVNVIAQTLIPKPDTSNSSQQIKSSIRRPRSTVSSPTSAHQDENHVYSFEE